MFFSINDVWKYCWKGGKCVNHKFWFITVVLGFYHLDGEMVRNAIESFFMQTSRNRGSWNNFSFVPISHSRTVALVYLTRCSAVFLRSLASRLMTWFPFNSKMDISCKRVHFCAFFLFCRKILRICERCLFSWDLRHKGLSKFWVSSIQPTDRKKNWTTETFFI